MAKECESQNKCARSVSTSIERVHQCTYMLSCSVMSNFVRPHRLLFTRLLCPWNFPSKNTEWVAISYFKKSSQPRDLIQISCITCIGRQILYHCITIRANIDAPAHRHIHTAPPTESCNSNSMQKS